MTQEMTKTKKAILILLLIGIVGLFVACIPALIPTSDVEANAALDYEYAIYNLDDGLWYLFYACCSCGHEYFYTSDDPDDWEALLWENTEDWIVLSDYCPDCYYGHLCNECYDEFEGKGSWCATCGLCIDCWDDSIHCHQCGSCDEDLCRDCLEGMGWHICEGCHSENAKCPGCGVCLYALRELEGCCEDYGAPHCFGCDEEWICDECGYCCYNDQEDFCQQCKKCIDCCLESKEHCEDCFECLSNISECDVLEGLCWDCCVERGNHCNDCDRHVEDEWCDGGQECGHCRDCAEDAGWLCEQCERCQVCNDFEWCNDCGLCEDCCKDNATVLGCECQEYCIESSDFESEEHLCPSCQANFSCAIDFCDDCELCIECCLANSENAGCECGLCVESSDYDDHLCPNCEGPTCVNGDFCDDCGLCEECCLSNSDAEGCSCGLCVESDDFDSPDHKCDECQSNFSCNIDFCEDCGLCEDCCAEYARTEYGCEHGYCPYNNAWYEHYCIDCEKCKEDCGCGKDCCKDPGGVFSEVHGSIVPVGTITRQPTDRRRTVSENDKYKRADNTATFIVHAYDPDHTVHYQWYVKEGDKAPVALVDDKEYILAYDDDLVFVGGSTTNKLTVATPCNACSVSYSYYCVTTVGGKTVDTSEPANLIGKHNYGYVYVDSKTHAHGCIGCGYIEPGSAKNHEVGSWRYARYATATEGALVVRDCRVCGHVADTVTTNPLGYYHNACDFRYVAITDTDKDGNEVCTRHQLVCRCGKKGGAPEEHTYSAWMVTKAADEKNEGSKYHDCAACGYRETVTIKKQTHEHFWTLDSTESPNGLTSTTGIDGKYHWTKCVYEDCKEVAWKEEHHYDEWKLMKIPNFDYFSGVDRYVVRTCKVCGYEQYKEIKMDYKAVVYVNATASAQSLDKWDSEGGSVYTATANPPKGYYFDHWEVVLDQKSIDLGYTAEDLFDFDQSYWVKRKDDKGNVTSTYRVYTDIYSEKIAFRLRHNYEWQDILWQLKAVCIRYDNELFVWPSSDKDDFEILEEGDTIATNYNPHASGVSKQDSVLWVEKVEEYQHGWFVYTEEDDYGERTMTVHLNGYRGGPIEVGSFEQTDGNFLPCNLHIIVDKDSVITTNGSVAIYGCPGGGSVTISSTTGATLTIKVKGVNPYSGNMYGIRTCYARGGFSDKVAFEGNVKVNLTVVNQGSGYGYPEIATGIYTKSQVQVLDDASLYIEANSWDHESEKTKTAVGIEAGKELLIDTTGCVEIKVIGAREDVAKKGQGVKAKAIIVENTDHFWVDFNVNVKNGYSRQPEYDARKFVEYKAILNDRCRKIIEPGFCVEFVIDQEDGVDTANVNVARWYTNEYGEYLVRRDENVNFTVTPGTGYYEPSVYVDGEGELHPYYGSDGVTQQYVLYCVDRAITVHVHSGNAFAPYRSQPAVSQKDVYAGSEARLSYRLNATDAIYYHSKLDGEKPKNPKFKKELGQYADPELITNNFTINSVFLQRYNEIRDEYENTGIEFPVSAVSEVTFNDSYKRVGETVKYRLMIVFDGKEYPSNHFSVTWTNDDADVPEQLVNMVELHIRHSRYDGVSGKFDDGDAWIRLDSENPYYIYSTTERDGFAGNSKDLLTEQRSHRNPILVAEFNYHKGTLILYGTGYAIDFNENGYITDDERFNLEGEILAIRTSELGETTPGGLIIDVRGDTAIGAMFTDEYGRTGGVNNVACEYYIDNEENGGFIRIKSTTGTAEERFSLHIIGTSRGRELDGIVAMTEVFIEGNVEVHIGLNEDIFALTETVNADRYGIWANKGLTLRGNALYSYSGGATTGYLRGDNEAVHTEEGNFNLLDNSSFSVDCDAYKPGNSCNALYVVGLNVVQNASMDILTGKNITVPIFAENILFATTGTIKVRSMSNEANVHGIYLNDGEFILRSPTTFEYQSNAASELMANGEMTIEGKYVHYFLEADPAKYWPQADMYYPGVDYTLSVSPYDDMKYYQVDYTVTVNTPPMVDSIDGYLITEYKDNGAAQHAIRMGDTVHYYASNPDFGFEFVRWEYASARALQNIVTDGRTISFTMPDCDVYLYPVYACIAFDEEVPCFVVSDVTSQHGTLSWRIDASTTLVEAHLEVLCEDGGWESLDWYLTKTGSGSLVSGLTRHFGEDALKVTDATGEGTEIDSYGVYRICAVSNDGEHDYTLYSKSFTIDFEGGVHILLTTDSSSADVLTIPSDYIGTEYVLYLGDYLYSDAGLTYEIAFGDIGGPIPASVCKAELNGRVVKFTRKAPHAAQYAIEGCTYITATDTVTGKTFRIPFTFGEILDTTVYPLAVNGKVVNEINASDILGDGKVSYDASEKKLTLNGAKLDKVYADTDSGALAASGYAILFVDNLTIELIGDNYINIDANSVCVNDPSFNGSLVAIGRVTNEAWTSIASGAAGHPILTITGTGSLTINVAGEGCQAIYNDGGVTLSADLTITSEEYGIVTYGGGIYQDGGTLTIDCEKKRCIGVSGYGQGIYLADGSVYLSGGDDDYAIFVENGSFDAKKEAVIESKSTTYPLANVYLAHDMKAYILTNDGFVFQNEYITDTVLTETMTRCVKFVRDYFIWVNGQRIDNEHTTVACGEGTAVYNPETMTLTLTNATITKGIAYYSGMPYAAGIYCEEPLTIELIGSNVIDLRTKDLYDPYTGEEYTPMVEGEENRSIYGIAMNMVVMWDNHGYDKRDLTITGSSLKIVGGNNGWYQGIDADASVILLGAKLTIDNVGLGISTFDGLILRAGSVRINTTDGEYGYAIYGDIVRSEDYASIAVFGCNEGDLERFNYTTLTEDYDLRWGQEYKSLWIRDAEIKAEVTAYHDWNAPTYVWNEDGTVTATRVCKNDENHIFTETVDVQSKVVKQPTCTETGETMYGAFFRHSEFGTQTRTIADIPALGHTHMPAVRENEVMPTCIAAGSHDEVIYCEVCGEELERETIVDPIDPNAHTWSDWTQTKAPQIGVKGEETRTCATCGETEKRDIAALPYVPTTKEDGAKVYEETVTEVAKDVTALFTQAKEEEGTVEVKAGDLVIAFDNTAVNALGDAEVTISAKIITEGLTIPGAELVVEVTLAGATFEAGSATVSLPFGKEVPEGKVAKVYYIDESGNKTDMNAVFAGGKVTFTTNHFSQYVVVFEDKATTPEVGPETPEVGPETPEGADDGTKLSAGAIAGIVVGSVVLLAAIGLGIFLLKKKMV